MVEPNTLIGKTKEQAKSILDLHGMYLRIVREDGQYCIVFHDIDEKRIDVEIENNIITKISE